MAFRTDDGQSARSFHLIRQLDVRTTSGHVRRDGHGTEHPFFFVLVAVSVCDDHLSFRALSCQGHDVGFALVELGIQHLVRDVAELEHTAEQFAHVHTRRTHQHGAAGQSHLFNFFNDGTIFLALRLVDAVVHVHALHRAVGGDFHHVELVDIPELAGFRDGRTRHARQFVVHTEIVLQRDGGKSLRGGFHLHVFLCLHGLVQSIAPAAALHDTARLLVHNLHLSVHHHIFLVDTEHGVGLEQLENGVDTFRLHGIILQEFVLAHHAFLVREPLLRFKHREFRGNVREDEELVVLYLVRQPLVTLVREVHAVQLLVHHKVERFHGLRHTAVVVLHIDFLRFEHTRLDARFGEELDERIVFGQCLVAAEELQETFLLLLLVARGDELLGLRQVLRGQLALHVDESLHERLVLFKELVVALGHGA